MTDRSDTLELTVPIAATAETVFRFFTDPERFSRWMGGAMGTATLEPEVGGRIRVEYPQMGRVVLGEVVELAAPLHFAFTWGYEGEDEEIPPGSSRVDVSLHASEHGTVLTLRHSGLPTPSAREQHRGAWRIYTAFLAAGACDETHGPVAGEAVAGWFASWAETDPARRRERLAGCCAPGVEFRDAHACLAGIEDLSGHVGASQAFSRGMALEHAGDVSTCHDHVRFGWRAVTADGTVVATGANVGRLDLAGKFLSVHGFRDEGPPAA